MARKRGSCGVGVGGRRSSEEKRIAGGEKPGPIRPPSSCHVIKFSFSFVSLFFSSALNNLQARRYSKTEFQSGNQRGSRPRKSLQEGGHAISLYPSAYQPCICFDGERP